MCYNRKLNKVMSGEHPKLYYPETEVKPGFTAANGIKDAFGSDFPHGEILQAENGNEMLEFAFKGNKGGPVDVVLMDGNFMHNGYLWEITEEKVGQFLDQNAGKSTHDIWRIYQIAEQDNDGLGFAFLLRELRYAGNIFLLSSTPPDKRYIQRTMQMLEDQRLSVQFPVNGMVTKPGRFDSGFGWYANATTNYKLTQINSSGLEYLLRPLMNIA